MNPTVMLTGAIVFFSPGTPTQVATAMIITVTMLSVTGIIQPFLLAIDDFIAVVAACTKLMLRAMCGRVFVSPQRCAFADQLLLTLLGGLLMSSGVAAADGYTYVACWLSLVHGDRLCDLTLKASRAGIKWVPFWLPPMC